MASTADDSTSYGGGAGGKFRKRPLRRPQTTPYDRPPTALRVPRRNNENSSTAGGWLSRIVDPASKLITSSAHKFFSSVFRKRLLPPPQPPLDEEVEAVENHLGDAMIDIPSRIEERDMIQGKTQNNDSMTDGVEELEHILKQKTFTRSEIDRLTELLHSRTVDKTATEGQRRFELPPSDSPACHSRQKEPFGTAFENGVDTSEFPGTELIPSGRSKVYVDDVASPTNIAKAYMGSRSSRVTPSVLGPISHAVREETPAFTAKLHRPCVSTVQKPLSPAGTYQNDLVVRRSRGRSAIYSMARTPYSRVQPIATKVPGNGNDAFDGQPLLSSQKVLKRRSSVLENDIGSVGPMRRTRQKPNLLYPKTSGLSSSCTVFANATSSGVGEASSSKSQENRGGKGIPVSAPHVSSKSIEMGQRILQQLEKLTPPKDKSNEKKPGLSGGISAMELTPAMLRGQARKSLETVDPLMYVRHDEAGGKTVDSLNASHEVQDFAAKEKDTFHDSTSKMLVSSSSKVYPEKDEARMADNDVMVITKNTAPVVLKTAPDVPRKSPAFQMSAYEDYLDLDDDAHLNEVATPSTAEVKRNLGASSMQSNGKLPEHSAFPGMKSSSNLVLENTTGYPSNTAQKGTCHSFSMDSVLNGTIGSSIPSFQAVSEKADIHASTISLEIKSSDKVSPSLFVTSPVMESSITKDVTSSVFAFAGAASTDTAIKSPGSDKKSTEAVQSLKQLDNTPFSVPAPSSGTMSSLGSFPLSSAAPSPVLFSSQSSFSGSFAQSTFTTKAIGVSAKKVGADAADSATATTAISGSSNSLAGSVAFPSFQATSGGSSAASDSSTLATSGTDTAVKSKETALGNLSNGNFSGAASVTTKSPAIPSFQFGPPTTSSTNSQLQGSQDFSSRSIFGDQILPSTTSASTIGSIPSQPSVSALPVLSGTSSLTNSGSLTSVSAFFSASSAFGSSSSVASSGSTSSTSTNIFGGSWQPTNSPVFGSASNNASSGLCSGASSAPTSTSASSGVAFGTSSLSAPANGSSAAVPFGSFSTSTATGSSTATSGPVFGASGSTPTSSVSSGFTFGKSSTTVPANGVPFGASSVSAASVSTPSVFGFGASSSASSSAPSSTFSFGGSSTSAASSAPSSTFSFGASSTPASSSAPSSTFSFGASSIPAASSAPSSTFSFGASSTPASSSAPSSTFSFGASSIPAASSAPLSTFSFGASSTSASSSSPSSVFSFGASSASSSAPFLFGASSASASSTTLPSTFSFGASSPSVTTTPAPAFSFGAAAPTPAPASLQPSQPAFGSANSVFGFGSTPSPSPFGSNDQMTMEDSMVEDSLQSHTASNPTSVFAQSPTSNFSFGMAQAPAQAPAPLGVNPFQFGGQQSQVAAPPPNPFQASGSFDGGSFSLGAGGNDKSNRRIVKANKNRNRKK